MFGEIKNNCLRVPSVLHDLQELASRQRALSSLTALNKIISSSQEEVEFLYKSDGIHIIMGFLRSDNNLANICLKILANASKRNEKVKSKLRNDNIFHLLAEKLQRETDFSKSNLILYSALIVVLVQGNQEAQNLMRTSGCLSCMVHILSCILDEAESKPLPCKSTELLIYAMIVSSKNQIQPENQSEMGRITPKVLEYLGKQTPFSDVDQLQVVKCLWLFLKCALDQNEINQQIFLNHSGLVVLFRSIQDVVDKGKCEQMGDLLVKMTGVLIKLKSHTNFLFQASDYCPLMILCSLLNTGNSLVVQQIIVFLDSLTKEIPEALRIINDQEISRRIKRAKIMFLRSQTAAELCENLLNRMEFHDETSTLTNTSVSSKSFRFNFDRESPTSGEFKPGLGLLKNYACIVHDVGALDSTGNGSGSLFSSFESTEGTEAKGKNKSLIKIRASTARLPIYRKSLREKKKNFRTIIKKGFPKRTRLSRFSIAKLLSEKISKIFQKFFSFFAESVDDFEERFSTK